jgi:hypothetical protein
MLMKVVKDELDVVVVAGGGGREGLGVNSLGVSRK